MTKRPSLQWYPGDHRRDVGVQASSFEARALWREMLDLMHDGEPYGHLTAGGAPIDTAALARMVGVAPAKCARWLAELEQRKVFGRTAEGVIYSRRMVKDEHMRAVRATAGAKGGNPILVNQEDKPPDKPKVKHRDNQKGKQKPTPAVAVASASALEPELQLAAAPNGAGSGWVNEAVADWEEFNQGTITHGHTGKALKPLVERHTWPVVRPEWRKFVQSPEARFGLEYFARTFGQPRVATGSQNASAAEQSIRNTEIALGVKLR
jgi:hypothetical protein